MTFETLMIVLGALAGGFVNGLTGFGTGLSGLPFWLAATPPPVAAQLAAACGVTGQVQAMPMVWRFIRWNKALPMVLAGVLGIPLGTLMLPHVSLAGFKLGVGLLLIAYCSFMLWAGPRPRATWSNVWLDALVGFGGGIMAGIAGLSGPLPAIWASFLGWSKDERRGVFQIFNAVVLAAMLVSSAVAGLATSQFLAALPVALPATFAGVWLGARLYLRLDDRRFDRLVLVVLIILGIALVVASQAGRLS